MVSNFYEKKHTKYYLTQCAFILNEVIYNQYFTKAKTRYFQHQRYN